MNILLEDTGFTKGFPGGSVDKESACNAGDLGLILGLRKIPCRRAWQSTPIFLPGGSHGQRSLVGYSPWGHKVSDTTEWLKCCYNTATWAIVLLCLKSLMPTTCACSVMSDCLQLHGLQWNFPGKNTGARCHFLLQGIFPTQGSNPHLLHWQADSLPLSHLKPQCWLDNSKSAKAQF